MESGPLAHVLLAGRPAVQRFRAAFGGLRKTACYDRAHDELTNHCRIAQLFGSSFRHAQVGAEIARPRCRASRSSRRDRRAEALPRLDVLLHVRLLRRRAPLFRGRRLQPDRPRPRRTTHAGDPGGAPLGAGASGRATRARATPDPRQPGKGFGGGGRQVEAPDRRAGRASLAAAAGSHCGAKASRPPQPTIRSVTCILVRRAIPVAQPESLPALAFAAPPAPPPRRDERAVIAPLSEETFKFQFTGSRACHDKFRQAQDLLRHRIPDGDLATIVEKALDLLIEQVKKERFATGRKARPAPADEADAATSRHVPDAIKREVFERDGGRCTFTDEHGGRCGETGALEFDHLDGFARTHLHRADRIRLLCRAHNQHAADQMYGRAFMERARASVDRLAAADGIPSG